MTANATVAVVESASPPTPTITADQLALIRSTIARGASDDELRLYLFDCQRQGVHPLDRLIHFTKRGGKYTPITSIDFMRIRAAATGECAGIDDATFVGTPKTPQFAASVTVWRVVNGQRCAFTATARWLEYKPDQNDFMWSRMPFTMLSKCAEALALRKGFPAQLSGLYAREELDQADVSAPASPTATAATPRTSRPATRPTRAAATAPSADLDDPLITPDEQQHLLTLAGKAAWSVAALRSYVRTKYHVEKREQLRRSQYDEIISTLFTESPPSSSAPMREPGEEG